VVECQRTARKIAGDFPRHNRRAVPLDGAQWFHRVVIFLPGGDIPVPNRIGASERAAFVVHDAIVNEAPCQRVSVAGFLSREVSGDRLGEIQLHNNPSFSEIRRYTDHVASTHGKVRFLRKGKEKHTVVSAAKGVEDVLRILEGRWKLVILFHLFGGQVRRFSELRRVIPAVSEKMLIQQLRQMERDGVVRRFVHHQVPPRVEYSLTEWGQALCPALDALLKWVDLKTTLTAGGV
jgi:DNA-binding HxlR family transcriptional regulator